MRADCPCRRQALIGGYSSRPRDASRPAWYAAREARAGVRVGLFEGPEDFLSRVSALDARWSALQEQVCGSARGVTCDSEIARALGPAWVSSFLSQLDAWRAQRDDWRGELLPGFFASTGSDAAALERFRAELETHTADVRRVSGELGAPDVAEPQGPIDRTISEMGQAAREAAEAAALPIGLGVAAIVAVLALSHMPKG